MSTIKRIELPVSNDLRLKNVKDGSDNGLWVVAGPSNVIAEAVQAGGVHVMTRRGPRVILCDRVVKLADGLAIVPIEVDFEAASNTTTTTAVQDMTADQLRKALADLESKNGTAKVTSSGRANGAGTSKSKASAAKTTATTVTKSAPAAAAVQDVDDDDLASMLVSN